MTNISFYSADRAVPIRNRKNVKLFLIKLFKKEMTELRQLKFIFCSDNYLLEINQQHLHHSYYTDVITFSLAAPAHPVEGEIYLSTDRIKENAKAYRETYQSELLRVMIHGALHLCGYKDKTLNQKNQMRTKENYYLQAYQKSFT